MAISLSGCGYLMGADKFVEVSSTVTKVEPIKTIDSIPPPVRLDDQHDWLYSRDTSKRFPLYKQFRADFSKPIARFAYETIFTMTFDEKRNDGTFDSAEDESLTAFSKYLRTNVPKPSGQ